MFIFQMRFVQGALAAILVPDLSGLDQPFEVKLFFIQHYLVVLVNPLVLLLSRKYHFSLSLWEHLVCFACYSIYIRALLWPISQLTMVNLNYSLCHTHGTPPL